MPLSRNAILAAIKRGALTLEPFSEDQVEKAHINLHLGTLDKKTKISVPAKGFVIIKTEETVTLSEDLCGSLEGRASLAKNGISIEQSSHFVEPGTSSKLTLEVFNASDSPYALQAGQPIAKLTIDKLTDTF